MKQEIININKEKDEEINILKEELLRTRQELEQSQFKQIDYRKEILELQQLRTKLENQIPRNDLFPEVDKKKKYTDLMSNCFQLRQYNDEYNIIHIEERKKISQKIKDILNDESEYIIFNKEVGGIYGCGRGLIHNAHGGDFIITNKGKIFIMRENTYNQIEYHFINLNLMYVSKQILYLILQMLEREPYSQYNQNPPLHLCKFMDYFIDKEQWENKKIMNQAAKYRRFNQQLDIFDYLYKN